MCLCVCVCVYFCICVRMHIQVYSCLVLCVCVCVAFLLLVNPFELAGDWHSENLYHVVTSLQLCATHVFSVFVDCEAKEIQNYKVHMFWYKLWHTQQTVWSSRVQTWNLRGNLFHVDSGPHQTRRSHPCHASFPAICVLV